jgi:hypothetical protein
MTSMFSGADKFWPVLERDPTFCTLFSLTGSEIRNTYGDYIKSTGRDLEAVMMDLNRWYDGYRSHPEQPQEDTVFNTWSIVSYLQVWELQNYWSATGGESPAPST